MKISEQEVRYVAALANLNLTDEEIARFQRDLDGILDHMDQLNSVDVTGVEPMARVLFEGEADPLRADTVVQPLGNEAALANAPQSGSGCFKVPKVIER